MAFDKPLDMKIVKDTLYDWAVAAVGAKVKVVRANQNGPAVQKPKVVILVEQSARPGARDEVRSVPGDPEHDPPILPSFALVGVRRLNVVIEVWAEEPFEIAEALRMGLQREDHSAILTAANLSAQGIGDFQDLSAKTDTEWQGRVRFEFGLLAAVSSPLGIGTIETVVLEGQVGNNDAGQTITTE